MQIVDNLFDAKAMVSVIRETKAHEQGAGVTVDMTDGGAGTEEMVAQNLYTISKGEEIGDGAEEAVVLKGEDELVACGQSANNGGKAPKSVPKGRESCMRTSNKCRPSVLAVSDETTVDNNSAVCLPSSLVVSCSSPGDGNKFLDPNAPEFTPSLSPCFYQHRMLSPPSGFPGYYLVDALQYNNCPMGRGFDLPPVVYGLPFSEQSQSHLAAPASAARPCYGDLPSPHVLGRPGSSAQSYWRPHARGQGPTDRASRSLLLTRVPHEVDDEELRRELSAWGEILSLDLGRRSEGTVTVHFYDIRHAQQALNDFIRQNQQYRCGNSDQTALQKRDSGKGFDDRVPHLCSKKGLIGGKPVYAQYSFFNSVDNASEYKNHGTVAVYDLDADVPLEDLRLKFEKYGDVKEVRVSASRLQKFVEFYDTRDAARALEALDGEELFGKRVRIEFGRKYVGRKWRPSPLQNGLVTRGMRGNPSPALAPGRMHWVSPDQHGPTSPLGIGVGMSPHHVYGHMAALQINGEMQQQQQQQALPWYGGCNGQQIHHPPSLSSYMPRSPGDYGPISNGNGSLNSPPGSRRRGGVITRNGGTGPEHLSVDVSHIQEVFDNGVAGGGFYNFGCRTGLTPRDLGAHYAFDEKAAELNQGAPRTTLMVRNIPNKYSRSELIKLLDEHCLQQNRQLSDSSEFKSAYDFVYLPIDFKNRCNKGYGFVNFTSVQGALRFYKSRHLKLWERFNSSKICEICYARLQGMAALEEHFSNSVFPCNTEKYLPVTFSPYRDGKECPPPKVLAALLTGRHSYNSTPIPSPTEDTIDFNNSGGGNGENVVNGINDTSSIIDINVAANQSSETSQR